MSEPTPPLARASAPVGALPMQDVLSDWYVAHARDLPWRDPACSPWGVLVSEIMLQQTPVARVLEPWRRWMRRWPTPAALAAATPADVLRAWGRLGYPRRALRLLDTATAIQRDHGGRVPDDPEALRALPGIGAYTAAAVACFAYRRSAAVLDVNVRRVLARAVGGQALQPAAQTVAERVRADALVPPEGGRARRWNQALMELGALVCTARRPRCGACPLAATCAWRAAGFPPDREAHRRRTQTWAGSDRQARGAVMRLLRASPAGVPEARVARAWSDRAQLARAVAGLVADGLAERAGSGAGARLRLPAR